MAFYEDPTRSPAVTVKTAPILNTPDDWDEWYRAFKYEAQADGSWQYVDLSRPEPPLLPGPPELPPYTESDTLTQEEKWALDRKDGDWQRQTEIYRQQTILVQRLNDRFNRTVSLANRLYFEDEVTPYRRLKALKGRLKALKERHRVPPDSSALRWSRAETANGDRHRAAACSGRSENTDQQHTVSQRVPLGLIDANRRRGHELSPYSIQALISEMLETWAPHERL
ncbi:hypothetical protein HRR83_001042 [Exophiala dermatitidis]|uniref:Uncharacterized protein n=2 Tax=Exophiala dermatitidis TaxID=5970 RepID=H6C7I6_EXODN|nr:uncharacterized protein HMPREF1120_07667 [Exophiala dermatitidis NIH/UT8656]KAJ4522559.1 hypothetical protein HRR75_000953 [Exophiala dermatitidis]EHY59682.1 hypothetical protein HMPREF1120_07667 [Exophiala dermatitidis NIH/UT8656]KAJ4525853.1 hypothetical protein HRR74_001046 [Exophiala dermatitidis]KAJ4527202.1 hypothetical protein HRR73_001999 [Exophiala dermatitidis]KAJ4532926.1 hypothetical protein HRR76_007900 [Exophiala dermatitidis]